MITGAMAEIDDFLGRAHAFAFAVRDIVEQPILDRAAGCQITVSQVKLLKLVATTGFYTLSDVALFLHVSNAAASKAVDRMVRRNLLVRREDERDRRSRHLTLTAAGSRLLDAYESARERKLQGIFVNFPRQELKRAAELLDRLSLDLINRTGNSDTSKFRNLLLRKVPGPSARAAELLLPAL